MLSVSSVTAHQVTPIVTAVIAALAVLALIWNVWVNLIRNRQVYSYHIALIDRVKDLTMDDINNGPWVELGYRPDWRWDALKAWNNVNGITYSKMCNQFWRRVDSFHAGAPFLKPWQEINPPPSLKAEVANGA